MTTTTDAEFGVFCPGILEVLSVGKGDLKLAVGDNVEDRESAKALIEEMMRKGYMIFVETDNGPERVYGFNPKRMTYTIADPPPGTTVLPESPTPPPAKPTKGARKSRLKEVPVVGSRATAVGRTAGG